MPARSRRRPTRHLPAEILLMIFSDFKIPDETDPVDLPEKRDGISTLATLARCSKWFYHISTPLLYNTVYVHSASVCDALIRTLSRQLDLGRLTHRLKLCFSNHHGNDCYPNIVKSVIRNPRRKFILPPTLRQRILSSRKYLSADEQIALLLSLVPNLEDLLVSLPAVRGVIDIFEYIIHNASSESHKPDIASSGSSAIQLLSKGHFAKLQTIRIYSNKILPPSLHSRNLSEQLVPVILRLPQLTTFSIQGIKTSHGPLRLDNIPENLSLQNLNLDSSWTDGQVLVDLISRCPRIRSLELIISDKPWYRFWVPIPLQKVGNFLRNNLGDCLVALTIKDYAKGSSCTGIIGSLRKLENLRMLWIPPKLLIGSGDSWDLDQWLPDSLEFVCFVSTGTKWEDGVIRWLHNQVIYMIFMETRPNLTRVYVHWDIFRARPYMPVDYARNIGRPGWNVAWLESELGLRKLVDPWPEMLEAHACTDESAFMEPRFISKE